MKIWAVLIFGLSVFLTACAQAIQTTQLETPQTIITILPSSTPIIPPTSGSTPSTTWISLSPDSGDPGTRVQVNGYLPGGLPMDELIQDNYLTHVDLCWGGCQTGLMISSLEVTWSQQEIGHFQLQFTVPLIPWLANDGIHRLDAGNYIIGLVDLDPNEVNCSEPPSGGKDCTQPSEVSASFHLDNGYTGPECEDTSSCGRLKALPAQGAPGDIIQVEGWAPLVQGGEYPFGYDLMFEGQNGSASSSINLMTQQQGTVRQQIDGSLTASFEVPQYGNLGEVLSPGSYTLALLAMVRPISGEKNSPPVYVAPIPFKVTAVPMWTERPRTAPLWIQPSASFDQAVSIDVNNPKRLAFCTTDAISYSQDGGKNWTSIPTDQVKGLVLPGDITIGSGQQPCGSVLLDSAHPDSFYAIFSAVSKQWGPPPFYYIEYFTTDRGKTWQIVPGEAIQVSSTWTYGRFGGFWTDGKVVQALYIENGTVFTMQTEDGGRSWETVTLTCPGSGPCLRWGAAPGQVSGMGSDLPQELMVSFDNGQIWSSTDQSVELRGEGPHELVALSATDALILSGNERYPMRYSPDGGKTWQALALPSLPGSELSWPFGYPGLQMLPDGSLLAMNTDTGAWWSLTPDGQGWCALDFSPSKFPVLLQPSDNRVFWISSMSGDIESASLSSFYCSQ